MNNYTGKICPFCRTAFKEDDDIVVCSLCEMPHHKDCWVENRGCTTFGCEGTIKNPEELINSSLDDGLNDYFFNNKNEYIFCSKCGAKHPADNKFCNKCGSLL